MSDFRIHTGPSEWDSEREAWVPVKKDTGMTRAAKADQRARIKGQIERLLEDYLEAAEECGAEPSAIAFLEIQYDSMGEFDNLMEDGVWGEMYKDYSYANLTNHRRFGEPLQFKLGRHRD